MKGLIILFTTFLILSNFTTAQITRVPVNTVVEPTDCKENYFIIKADCPTVLAKNDFFACNITIINGRNIEWQLNKNVAILLNIALKTPENPEEYKPIDRIKLYFPESNMIDDRFFIIPSDFSKTFPTTLGRRTIMGDYIYSLELTCEDEVSLDRVSSLFEVTSQSVFEQIQNQKEEIKTSQQSLQESKIFTLLGVVLGALLTFFIQNYIQNRQFKIENIKLIYAPLSDELSRIKNDILNWYYNPSTSEWNRINNEHLLWRIKNKLNNLLFNFFNELHNFGLYATVADTKIRDIIKKEFENRRITERSDFDNLHSFIENASKLVLRLDKTGGYIGSDITPIVNAQKYFGDLKKYYKLKEFETLDDLIRYLVNKIENEPLIKDVKGKQTLILEKLDNLIPILEKESKLSFFIFH